MQPSPLTFYRLRLAILSLVFFGVWACSDSSDSPANNPRDGSDASSSNTFEKPNIDPPDCNALQYFGGESSSLSRLAICPRDYMKKTTDGFEKRVWLYRGERAVFDIATRVNRDVVDQYVSSGTYYFYVFIDFRAVPFAFLPIAEDADFPATDELPEDLDLRHRATLDLRHKRVAPFTVVLPPESMEPRGAHDLRFVFLSKEEATQREVSTQSSHRYSTVMHLNYGGTNYPDDVQELDAELVKPPDVLAPIAGSESFLLYPEYEVYDPTSEDSWEDIRYGRQFETTASKVDIHGLIPGQNIDGPEEIYVVTMENGYVREEPGGRFTLPKGPSPTVLDPGKYAAKFAFEVELSDGEPHRFQALFFREPFGFPFPVGVVDSNLLTLQRASE